MDKMKTYVTDNVGTAEAANLLDTSRAVRPGPSWPRNQLHKAGIWYEVLCLYEYINNTDRLIAQLERQLGAEADA
jgi:hypothetical protein